MVALIEARTHRIGAARPAPSRSVTGRRSPRPTRAGQGQPPLTSIDASRAAPAMATAALALVVVLGVLGLRAVQGTPPAATWGELHRASLATGPGPPGPGDAVVTVSPGDTLWGIARSLRPGGDPRPVVDALARANGGSTLQAGQQLLIPARLLDG